MTVDPDVPAVADGDGTPWWRWLFADVAGVAISEPDLAFESQEAAEGWLRDNFDALTGDGVATVTLIDGEHAVYGPIFLAPEGDGPVAEAEF